MTEQCDHYFQPKYDPAIETKMLISRCTKCGYERWASVMQRDEWMKNGLKGRQIDAENERGQS